MAFWTGLFHRAPRVDALVAKDTAGPARRATIRHPHGRMTFGEVLALPANTPVLFKIKDISVGGLGLLCREAIQVGSFLAVKLEGPEYTRVLRARVVHLTEHGHEWLMGCALLDRLNRDELKSLLTNKSR